MAAAEDRPKLHLEPEASDEDISPLAADEEFEDCRDISPMASDADSEILWEARGEKHV